MAHLDLLSRSRLGVRVHRLISIVPLPPLDQTFNRRSTDVRFRYRVARPCQLLGQGLRVGSSGLSSRTVRETASDNRLTSSFNHDPRRPRRRVCSVVGQLFRRGEASPTRPLSPYRLERTWRGGETFAYIDRQFSARTNPRDAFRLPFPGREVDASLSPLPVPIPTLVYPLTSALPRLSLFERVPPFYDLPTSGIFYGRGQSDTRFRIVSNYIFVSRSILNSI